jgi:hypothetical protein
MNVSFDNNCFDCGLQGTEWTNPSTLNMEAVCCFEMLEVSKSRKPVFMSKKFSRAFKF